jgi:glycosyltransferase involved in cell wall biosynthesis
MMQSGEGDRSQTQVIIAALNEEPGIGPTLSDLKEHLRNPKILVVDGNSHDRTVEIAKNEGADVICQDGKGKGDAIMKAIQHADLNVDHVVLTDADYTYPAENIPKMIKILEQNPDVGMVCGNRFDGLPDEMAWQGAFHFGNRLLSFAHNMLNGVALRDPLTGLRAVRAGIMRGWTVKSKGFEVEVELNHQVERRGFTIVEIPIKYRPRLGEKKLGMKHGFSILKRIMLETTY